MNIVINTPLLIKTQKLRNSETQKLRKSKFRNSEIQKFKKSENSEILKF